jgi:transposase
VDRKRKKKGSNRDWVSPHDRDARITKMKDGRTHLAHKAEHAVDMETGAVVAVTLQEAHQGDTTTVKETLAEAGETVAQLIEREAETAPAEAPKVNLNGIEEVVADKGYHSGPVLEEMKAAGVRTYIPEKKQTGQRHWTGKEAQQQVVYANRQRLQRPKGKRLLRQRGDRQRARNPGGLIPDFSNWKDHDWYEKAFDRLVRDLKAAVTLPARLMLVPVVSAR